MVSLRIWLLLALTVLVLPRVANAQERSSPDYGQGTYVVLLGTGTPNADPDRSGPATAVVVDGVAFIVDAGPGVVRQAAAAARNGIGALAAANLDRVFLTHLHSDHTIGLPDLLLTPWVLERATPLAVYGPAGTAAMVEHLLAAYDADIHRRIDGSQPQNRTGQRAEVHEITPGIVYRDSTVTVTAFAVAHEDWSQAFGFRFETADGVVVVSGDTRPTESVVTACDGCDILVHEVYSEAGFARRSPEWQRYHARAHTSASQLADLASRARPGRLVLTHQLFWGTDEADLLAEVRARYGGEVVSGRDLDVFPISPRR
jgi:ribonuclease BN (tRNA processing enzyme)